jgi:hypothetical protein
MIMAFSPKEYYAARTLQVMCSDDGLHTPNTAQCTTWTERTLIAQASPRPSMHATACYALHVLTLPNMQQGAVIQTQSPSLC